ncbi:MAG: hypothetical protein HYU66_11215 [Armatimonadetes bacterium]|nr:hypothetical protein [Armatimonadota bacterium]
MGRLTGAVRVTARAETIRVAAFDLPGGGIRAVVGNESHWYVIPELDFGRELSEVRVLTDYPHMPIHPDGHKVRVKVPPRGVVVMEVR